MTFDDLICDQRDIEYGICVLAGLSGEPPIEEKCEIREGLTDALNGCWPYYDEIEEPCYKWGCEYGCESCPMKGHELVHWNQEDGIASLIKAVKNDAEYEVTAADISTAMKIMRR